MLQASKQVNGLQHAGVQVGYFEHIVFHAVHDIKTSHSLIDLHLACSIVHVVSVVP